jgi:type III restriction enzyme
VATAVVEVDIMDAGVSADRQISSRLRDVAQLKVLPDTVASPE